MSREDPQFKLRMSQSLRDQVEQAAKAAGRSLNAELINRLEASFLGETASSKLMPATRAKELALMARNRIPDEIRRRSLESIDKAIRLGHRNAAVDLADLHLDVGIADEDLDALLENLFNELKIAGYKVKWDDITSIWIEF